MVGIYNPLTISELGQLVGLLAKYEDELLYEAQEGELNDECADDTELRNVAIERVSACIKAVNEDLQFRLENY